MIEVVGGDDVFPVVMTGRHGHFIWTRGVEHARGLMELILYFDLYVTSIQDAIFRRRQVTEIV